MRKYTGNYIKWATFTSVCIAHEKTTCLHMREKKGLHDDMLQRPNVTKKVFTDERIEIKIQCEKSSTMRKIKTKIFSWKFHKNQSCLARFFLCIASRCQGEKKSTDHCEMKHIETKKEWWPITRCSSFEFMTYSFGTWNTRVTATLSKAKHMHAHHSKCSRTWPNKRNTTSAITVRTAWESCGFKKTKIYQLNFTSWSTKCMQICRLFRKIFNGGREIHLILCKMSTSNKDFDFTQTFTMKSINRF